MLPTQLRAFHAVAEHGSFSEAALRVGVTQPALTIQVRNLEKAYGVRLFDRAGDGVRLTPAGEHLYRLTGNLFTVQDDIEQFLAASRDLETGMLRLSADGPHLATRLIAAFRAAYPGVEVSLRLGNAPAVWEDLAGGRADAVISADAPDIDANYTVPVMESRLVVIVGAGHPWFNRRRISIQKLTGQDAIVRERRSNTRRTGDRLLRDHDVALGSRLVLESREAVVEAVAAGLGLGFIFDSEITPDPRLRALRIHEAAIANREVAACLNARRHYNLIRAFMDTATRWRPSAA